MSEFNTEDLYDSIPETIEENAKPPTSEEVESLEKAWSLDVETLAIAEPHPDVDTYLNDSDGVYGYYATERRYGLEETILAIHEVGKVLSLRYPGRRFGVGDISKKGGGPISGHASHQKGIDFDVRLLRKDWVESSITYHSPNYSLTLTQELIDLFWANSNLAVQFIFFNDAQTKGTRTWPNHDNHLHVRFFSPGSGQHPPELKQNNDLLAANHELQRRLNFWHKNLGRPGDLLIVDGIFGTKTVERLKEFQSENHVIPVNGIANNSTWKLLPLA